MHKDTMTSREIVKRCIEFRDPPRIAMHFAVDSIQGKTWSFSDFAGAGYVADPGFVPAEEGRNEWGVLMESLDPASMGESVDPPIKDWAKFDFDKLPDFSVPARYSHLQEQVESLHAQERYVFGNIPSQMLLPIALRGMENWFMDHVLEQDSI
ncbi:MAG: hypothetical protein KAS17_01025, partial [Victivallaceae bacterium]|nr:hypothetical protein [Victivallaceae bacterium]